MKDMIEWNLILRLLIAGLLGGLIGLERELRAKGAGLRTHFVVALGSALFMLISQYAFGELRYDASRVAAQVVSGIGFIGAGVIIFQKNAIRGVTTAAGLWVVAAIGLAAGAGMYAVAGAAAILTILCLETAHFLHLRYGEKVVSVSADCSAPDSFGQILTMLAEKHILVENYSLKDGRASFRLRLRLRSYRDTLPAVLSSLKNPSVEDEA